MVGWQLKLLQKTRTDCRLQLLWCEGQWTQYSSCHWGRHFRSWSSVTSDLEQGITGEWRNYCAPDQQASKPANVLQNSRYVEIVLSISASLTLQLKYPVYVQLEFQLCPYCNVTLNPVGVPNWWILAGSVFNLRNDNPAYSIKAEDYTAKLLIASAYMRMLTLHRLTRECVWRLGLAAPLSRRVLDHSHWFEYPALEPAERDFDRALFRAFLAVGIVTLSSCMISYLISLILHMKVCDVCSDIIEL